MARDVSTKADLASAWLIRFSPYLEAGSRVLEIAAGNGRNTRFLAGLGCRVTAADIHLAPEPVDGVTADLSFISLRLILPAEDTCPIPICLEDVLEAGQQPVGIASNYFGQLLPDEGFGELLVVQDTLVVLGEECTDGHLKAVTTHHQLGD